MWVFSPSTPFFLLAAALHAHRRPDPARGVASRQRLRHLRYLPVRRGGARAVAAADAPTLVRVWLLPHCHDTRDRRQRGLSRVCVEE
ncbi:hypothetical protein B484DRAFT_444250 [Ochromonadaceae sp. CCMP2298]|nr:hypothetical protein B484DRAFT_444250 [Ochromonadaceae sp. CCMP2298]